MMTKQSHAKIADAIASTRRYYANQPEATPILDRVADDMALQLELDNPGFKPDLFLKRAQW